MRRVASKRAGSTSGDEQIDSFLEAGFFWKEFGLKQEDIKRMNPRFLAKLRIYYKVKQDLKE